MSNDYFVMLSTGGGRATPMTDDDGDVAFYSSKDAARADAKENPLGHNLGFEIFELGTGDG